MGYKIPLKKEDLDNFSNINTRFTRVGFCDDLVSLILKDITEHPEKYYGKPVLFIGERSPLDYCATSLRALLSNRGIGGVNIGTADAINGLGNYFNVDDYLKQRFIDEDRVLGSSLPVSRDSIKLSHPYFFDGGLLDTPAPHSETWTLD